MVDERPLVDLIVRPGIEIVSAGRLEVSQEGTRLWVASAWEPERDVRHSEGHVPLLMPGSVGRNAVPEVLVEVTGAWVDGAIRAARIAPTPDARVAAWHAPAGRMRPGELGGEQYARLSRAFTEAAGTPVLSSGGTDEALWYHVLYVTPELVDAHRAWPTRVDVFAGIVPAVWRGAGQRT